MKNLFLVRHAKSSWDDPALPDKDRPLAARGKRNAPKMGRRLAKRGVKPDLLLSSPAQRALATAQIFATELGCNTKDIVLSGELYAAAADELLALIRAFDDDLQEVMLFGHNPELLELAQGLSSKIDRMPTCAVAEFRFDVTSWSDVGTTKPAKVALDRPKKS